MLELHLFTQPGCQFCEIALAGGLLDALRRVRGARVQWHDIRPGDNSFREFGVGSFPALVLAWDGHQMEWPGCLPEPFDVYALNKPISVQRSLQQLVGRLPQLAPGADAGRELFPPALTSNVSDIMLAGLFYNAHLIKRILSS